MIGLAIFIGTIVAYLVIGFAVAAWDMPSLHARIKDSPEYRNKSWQARADAARGIVFMTAILWPVRAPYLVAVRLADKSNPDLILRDQVRREQAIADRELEIKELERRMKVGQDYETRQAYKVNQEELR